MKRTVTLIILGISCLMLPTMNAFAVTQDYLDRECRKLEVRVLGSETSNSLQPARVIIGYSCSEIGSTVEYEAMHFICPRRGPQTMAATVYDVQGQRFLRDLEERGNYRSMVKPEEVPSPACDLPL